MTVSLPVGGYVPGQDIPISVDVENNSDVPIHEVKCTLKKVWKPCICCSLIHLLKTNKATSYPCLVDCKLSVLEERLYIMTLAIVLFVSAFPYHSHLKVKWSLPILTVRVHWMVRGVVFGFSSYNRWTVIYFVKVILLLLLLLLLIGVCL